MNLQQKFGEAGVPLVVAETPLFGGSRSGAEKVFQMTIETKRVKRGKPKVEIFEIYPGADDNDIRVIDIDKGLRQVILSVHEPRRTFTFYETDRQTRKRVKRTRTTPDWKRTYLLGRDTTHLFISELERGASTVKEAHDRLKPAKVRGEKRAKRQGEWFFLPVTPPEERLIDGSRDLIESKGVLPGNTRNSHAVEELLEIDGKIFARGKVSHPEHRAMLLRRWYSVTRNTERDASVDRVGWID